MKTQFVRCCMAISLALTAASLQAQPSAHYVPGSEGIKGASLPPPGWYVRDYNVFYYADRVNVANGDEIAGLGVTAFTYANVPRVIWITDTKFLGGFVGVDALLPLVYHSLKVDAAGYDHSTFGIGDFFAEATLSWHVKQFDFSAGCGLWMPTGDSPNQPYQLSTSTGQGYWTPMLTAGATWYIDTDKTWAVSALNRYEFNTEQRDTHITPGQAYTLEWGISKTLAKVYDVGVVGYYQQQVTTDSGSGASPYRDRAAAVGPEISVAFPKCMTFLSLRYLYEFMVEGGGPVGETGLDARAQGHTVTLTLTHRF